MAEFGYLQTIKSETAPELLGSRRANFSSQLGSLRSVGTSDSVEFVQVRADLRAIATAIRQLEIYQGVHTGYRP